MWRSFPKIILPWTRIKLWFSGHFSYSSHIHHTRQEGGDRIDSRRSTYQLHIEGGNSSRNINQGRHGTDKEDAGGVCGAKRKVVDHAHSAGGGVIENPHGVVIGGTLHTMQVKDYDDGATGLCSWGVLGTRRGSEEASGARSGGREWNLEGREGGCRQTGDITAAGDNSIGNTRAVLKCGMLAIETGRTA